MLRRGGGIGTLCGSALLLLACAGTRTLAPSTDIDEAGFREHVRILASDDFEGRRPGTAGEDKTVAYLTGQFRKLGLKPGNGASFLQPVPLVEMLAGTDASLSISGAGGVRSLGYGKDMVIWTKRVQQQSAIRQSELVFAGYGIVAPEYAWNDYAQLDVRGKTVVLLVGDPGTASKDPHLFKGAASTPYGRWVYKFAEAAKQGASGALLIHDPAAAGYGWEAVVNRWTGPQQDASTPDGNAGRTAIEGWISAAAARALFADAGLDANALTAAAGRSGFKAVDLGLRADAEVRNSVRQLMSSNVIAILAGSGRRREYVLYTAHWDHLGRAGTAQGGAIFNGAVDNASGTAGLLMLAQAFSRTRPAPERSIVFLALTGEESGLLGSGYYVGHPVLPLKDAAAVLNLDTLHVGGPTRDVTVFGLGNSELDDYVRDAAALQGREIRPDPTPDRGYFLSSGHYNFAKHGVPVLYAKGGIDDTARGPAWGQAQLDDYIVHRFLQTGDKYSADWDVRGTLDDLRLYYAVGTRLATGRRYPRWLEGSEFRGGRERGREDAGD
jgi:Zn-dependent M28 family amino/carboxypeptidase